MTNPPGILDLFSGACGGWSLGMHRAGFRTVAACEADPWRRAIFSHNFPGARMYDDVRTLTAARLVSDIGAIPDIIVGSPPCQDASVANQKGQGVDGDRTGLFFEAVRIVGECRPRWAAFENVPAIRTRGVDRIIYALEGIGYACVPAVVGADDVSRRLHSRKRAWIIAFDAARVGRDGWRPWGQRKKGDIGASTTYSISPPDAGRPGWEKRHGAESIEPEIPEFMRDIAEGWTDWNRGIGEHLRVRHGLSSGMARDCISAYGDAVLPQITEAIGRSIWRVEAALAAGSEGI